MESRHPHNAIKLFASVSSAQSVKNSVTLRIIHLDCNSGGDCTVFLIDKYFVVIDGGKGLTGDRLAELIKKLLKDGYTPHSFVISHFDLDHYYGLVSAITMSCGEMANKVNQVTLYTPVDQQQLNKDWNGELDSVRVSQPALMAKQLKEDCSKNKLKIQFMNADNFSIGAWEFELKSTKAPIDATIANGNNESSLMWLIRDKDRKHNFTYYTGGDSESGPIEATIVKLDHHGSNVKHCNAKILPKWKTKAFIVMGPGEFHGEGHPNRSLLNKISPCEGKYILSTCHYFDDEFSNNKFFLQARKKERWGDIGISVLNNGKFRIMCGKRRIRSTDFDTDNELDKLLEFTSNLYPEQVSEIKLKERGAAKEPEDHKCFKSGCAAIANAVGNYSSMNSGWACHEHEHEWLTEQEEAFTLKNEQYKEKERAEKKRWREEDEEDEDFIGDEGPPKKKKPKYG